MPDPTVPVVPASATAPAAPTPTANPIPAVTPAPVVTPAVAPTATPAPAVTPPVTPPTTPAPEVKLTLPENSPLKQADVDAVAAQAKALGLNQAQADALLAQRQEAHVGAFQSISDGFKAQQLAWVEAIQKDPELGGTAAEMTAKAEQAKVGLGRLFTANELAEIENNGFGNAPYFLRAGLRHYQANVQSPNLVNGKDSSSAPKPVDISDKGFAEALYSPSK